MYFALERGDALTPELVNDLIGAIYNLLDTEITGTGRSVMVFTTPKLNGLPRKLNEEEADQLQAAIETVNEALEQMAMEINSSLEGHSTAEVIFFDLAEFLENNSDYYKDHIHLNCDGYSGWASATSEILIDRISP